MENFELLKDIYDDYLEYLVFDPNKMIALKRDVPLSSFSFHNFVTLYLY